nr:sulfurtransferase complex subunit TusB [Halomonas olivaria]
MHILNKAPHSDAAQQVLQVLGKDDVLLLIEEAVQIIVYPDWEGWKQHSSRIYLLEEDVLSRGFQAEILSGSLPVVNISKFVSLTEQHKQSVTWY